MICQECGKEFAERYRGQEHIVKTGRSRPFCSKECSGKVHSRESSERMARTNRKYASERMKRKNPMHDPVAKAKMKTTLRAMGWGPPVRGGNGHPPPLPQQLLASSLGWPMEVVVTTGVKKGNAKRVPFHYKIDIANETLKVGVEVDGESHCLLERQKQDAKKEAVLRSLGWTILRFSNAEVTDHLEDCVQTVLSTISKLKGRTPTPPTE